MNSTLFFAKNLRQKRREMGLTQKALAQKISYSEKAVSKWENGVGLPPSFLLPTLAKILETSIDELMSSSRGVKYYLGIDGGGTKTEFALADTEGHILRKTILAATNPNDVSIAAVYETLRSGILEVIAEYNANQISVFAGIAGMKTSNNAEKICKFLSKFGFASVACGSDVENAVSVGLNKENGIALILGTGSVAFAQNNGKQFRVGGYGYLLGDVGSGFAFGRDALLAALQQEDGSGPDTLLYPLVKEQCGCDSVGDQIGAFYLGGKREIAKYAPLVFRAAEKKDIVANEILERNIHAVAQMIQGAARHLNEETIRVVLCGGLTAEGAKIVPLLEKKLGGGAKTYRISICQKPVVLGALYLAGMKEKQTC